tara:strand:- start:130 stop:375 length:246 start_codon:yes stop_codon:yes gene_type:complete
MTDSLRQALTILLVGMTTVFFILSIVVIVGNLMMSFLNSSNFVLNKKDTSHIPDAKEKAILSAAIQKWSNGKANISGITKL